MNNLFSTSPYPPPTLPGAPGAPGNPQTLHKWAAIVHPILVSMGARGGTFYEVSTLYGLQTDTPDREFIQSINTVFGTLFRQGLAFRLAFPDGRFWTRRSNQGKACLVHFAQCHRVEVMQEYKPLMDAYTQGQQYFVAQGAYLWRKKAGTLPNDLHAAARLDALRQEAAIAEEAAQQALRDKRLLLPGEGWSTSRRGGVK